MSLRHKAVSGLRWSSLAQGGRHAVQLVTTVVLVTLLNPDDFGLIGMSLFFVTVVSLLGDPGTSTALLRERHPTTTTPSTIFWLNVAGASLATGALVLIAPLVAAFYDEPRVGPILAALAFSIVLTGLGSEYTEFLVLGVDDCVSVISGSEPAVEPS